MRLIDADTLKKSMAESVTVLKFNQEFDGLLAEIIDNAPTVELQMGRMTNGIITPINRPTLGHWKELMRDFGYECSICHYIGFKTNYCPNCGAKMKGAEK